jgi:hypothetical protein
VKVALAAELIDAAHPALEYRKEALDGVGVNVAAHILAATMVHMAVSRKMVR